MDDDSATYLHDWAKDIRKHNGKSVDADRLDSIAREIIQLRSALVPFAKAYRLAHLTGLAIGARWCEAEAFARAAELVPPEKGE